MAAVCSFVIVLNFAGDSWHTQTSTMSFLLSFLRNKAKDRMMTHNRISGRQKAIPVLSLVTCAEGARKKTWTDDLRYQTRGIEYIQAALLRKLSSNSPPSPQRSMALPAVVAEVFFDAGLGVLPKALLHTHTHSLTVPTFC